MARNLAVMLSVLMLAGLGTAPASAARRSIRDAPGPSVRLLILDASTAQPIRNADLTLHSDNGIRCIRAPCPTDARTWQGRIDAAGRIDIPRVMVGDTVTLDTGTMTGDLIEDSSLAKSDVWAVELLPKPPATGDAMPLRPLKLMDARTGKAIAFRSVRIEYRTRTSAPSPLHLRANALGYVFLPADIPAGAEDRTWVIVSGFRESPLDYAWARHRMNLSRS